MTEGYVVLKQTIKHLPQPSDDKPFACAMPDAKPPRDRCVEQCPHCREMAARA